MINAMRHAAKNAGDQIWTNCTALVFSRIFEQARRAARSHPKPNPANRKRFRTSRRIFAIRPDDLEFRSSVLRPRKQRLERPLLKIEPTQ
jgi:hypothetical protein